MNRRMMAIGLSVVVGACAAEKPQRAPDMDPSNPDAPAGRVQVSTALKPTVTEDDSAEDAAAKGSGHDHAAMSDMKTGDMKMKDSASATVYTCPMHPEVRQNAPGKCPKCGMKLVPAAADSADAGDNAHSGHTHLGGMNMGDAKAKDSAATTATVYTCPMHPEVRQSSPGKCPKCGMKLVPAAGDAADAGHNAASPSGQIQKEPTEKNATKTVFTCPMHPEVQQSGPGKCPKCGMKLVPKTQGDKAATGHEAH